VTERLVRMPDQFRPARDTPMAATPTCCCCCCCCIATLITSSVVLPMRVELMSRGPDGQPMPADQVRASKWIAGGAPFLSFGLGIVLGVGTREIGPFGWGFPIIFVLLVVLAFAPLGRGVAAIPTTIVFFAAFAAEFVIGLFGVLSTGGLLYLAYGVIMSWLVIRGHRQAVKRLREGTSPASFSPPSWSPPTKDLPPLPRPPSSEE